MSKNELNMFISIFVLYIGLDFCGCVYTVYIFKHYALPLNVMEVHY